MKKAMQKILFTMILGSMVFMTACSKTEDETSSINKPESENSMETETSKLQENMETKENEESEENTEVNESKEYDEVESALMWKFSTGGKVIGTPLVEEGILYFGSYDGKFYAVEQETGNEVWSYSLDNAILCKPAFKDGVLYFCGKEIYIALDSITGSEIWRKDMTDIDTEIKRKDTWDYHDSSPVIDEDVVYYGSVSGKIYGFDTKTGELSWEVKSENTGAVRGTVAIENGVLYYGDWAGFFRAVNISDKKILWEVALGAPFQSEPIIADGVIYVGGRNTKISALSLESGDVLWEYKDSSGSWITGNPVIDEQTLYVSTSDAKKVYALNITDGMVKAEYPIYKNSFSEVVVNQGKLYVTSGDAYDNPGTGKVQVYDLNDPSKPIWEYVLKEGGIFSDPVVVENMIYFGCNDHNVYAIEGK